MAKEIVNQDEKIIEEKEFSAEETKSQMRAFEGDIIQGLIAAAGFKTNDIQTIEIARGGQVYFTFRIRPLSEEEYDKCKKKHTKYVRNKQLGVKLPEDTNNVRYRASLIYTATIEEDQKQLWDNKSVWTALTSKGIDILTGLDVIEYTLKAGEKEKIIEAIDKVSGYESNLEEVAKN